MVPRKLNPFNIMHSLRRNRQAENKPPYAAFVDIHRKCVRTWANMTDLDYLDANQ